MDLDSKDMGYKYLRVRSKKKNTNYRVRAVTLMIFAAALLYCLIFPTQLGEIGRFVKGHLSEFMGKGMFMVPFFMALCGLEILRRKKITIIHGLLTLLIVSFGCTAWSWRPTTRAS